MQTYRYITLGRLKVGRIPEKSMAKLRIQQAVFRFIQGFLENLQQTYNNKIRQLSSSEHRNRTKHFSNWDPNPKLVWLHYRPTDNGRMLIIRIPFIHCICVKIETNYQFLTTKSIWKMLDPFSTASRRMPHYHSPGVATVASHAACTSMSTTTTTTRDRGDRYGPMEWAQ